MSVYRRPDSPHWWVCVIVDKRPPIRLSANTSDKREAERVERRIRQQVEDGTYNPVTRDRLTLRAAFDLALETHWAHAKARHSVASCSNVICSILGTDLPLEAISGVQILKLRAAMEQRGNSAATVNRKISALQKVMGLAYHDWKSIPSMPRFTRQRESEGRRRCLSAEEELLLLSIVLAHPNPEYARYVQLFAVLVDTGLRLSEALDLKRIDVDLERRGVTVWINKGRRPRNIPLTSRAYDILASRTYLDQPFEGFEVHQAERAWNYAKDTMGLSEDSDFVIHALRHTFASRLVQRHVPIEVVQNLLGHRSIQTTQRYAVFATHNFRDAIGVLEPAEGPNLSLPGGWT